MEIIVGGIYKMEEEWKERVGTLAGNRVVLVVEKQSKYIAVAVLGMIQGHSKKTISFSYFYKLKKYYASIDCSKLYEDVPENLFAEKVAEIDRDVVKLILNIHNGVFLCEVENALYNDTKGKLRVLTQKLDNMSLLLRQVEQEPVDEKQIAGITKEIQQALYEIQESIDGVKNIITETKNDTEITRNITVRKNKKLVIFLSEICSFLLGRVFGKITDFLANQMDGIVMIIDKCINNILHK